MEHEWIKDDFYEPVEDSSHTEKWDCKNCGASLYEWIGMRDKKFQEFYYILVGNTQYGLNHKCKRKLL